MTQIISLAVVLGLLIVGTEASAAVTDDEARRQVIQQSIAAYLATGHPCACPYNAARNGSSCGGRSAYSRPGGAAPLCYPRDVSDGMVVDWRRNHP